MVHTVKLHAGQRTDGSDVTEEVLVESASPGRLRLLRSPGLVLGLAAGDVFTVGPRGTFEVISRGGNLCVQIFVSKNIDTVDREAALALAPLEGRRDGRAAAELVFTIPVRAGFEAIEVALRALASKYDGVEWYFGNVYDPTDGTTPLNWWK